jgi:photosystem II stability/assembly factor-like uncharacterized protein
MTRPPSALLGAALALAAVAGCTADDGSTALELRIAAPEVELGSLTARVTILDEVDAPERALPALSMPRLPGVVRVLLPQVDADIRVQLVGADADGRRHGAVATTRSIVDQTIALDLALELDGGWLWTEEASGTDDDLLGVAVAGDHVVAVGAGGTILERDPDGTWRPRDSGTVGTLTAVAATSDAWIAGGAAGCPLRRSSTGEAWTSAAMCPGGAPEVRAIWADGGRVVVVGLDGSCHRSDDGVEFEPCAIGDEHLLGVWGAGDEVAVVGADGRLATSSDGGRSFSIPAEAPVTLRALAAIWGRDDERFVVGEHGAVFHFDGTYWTTGASHVPDDLTGVAGLGRDVFAVGRSGALLRSQADPLDWAPQPSPTPLDLHAIAAGPADLFAVGEAGTILHGR